MGKNKKQNDKKVEEVVELVVSVNDEVSGAVPGGSENIVTPSAVEEDHFTPIASKVA